MASRDEALPVGLNARLLAPAGRAGPVAAVLAAAVRPAELPVRVTVLELRLVGAGGLRVRAEGALALPVAVPVAPRDEDRERAAAGFAAAAGSSFLAAAGAASKGAAALAAVEAPAEAAAAGLAAAGAATAASAASAGLAAGGEVEGLLNFSAAPVGRQKTSGAGLQAAGGRMPQQPPPKHTTETKGSQARAYGGRELP